VRGVLDKMLQVLNRDVRTPELQPQRANAVLTRIIRNWAIDPEWLESGEFMSRIRRLPPNWAQACLEVVNGEGQYRYGSGFSIRSLRLLNFSSHDVSAVSGIKQHPSYSFDGSVKSDEWDEEKLYAKFPKGKVTNIGARWGGNTLYDYSKQSWPPHTWRKWTGTEDCLREVAYTVELETDTGERQLYDSNEHKRGLITEALALADKRIDENDYDAADSAVADVAHLLIDGAPVGAVADKQADIVTAREAPVSRPRRGRPRKAVTEE